MANALSSLLLLSPTYANDVIVYEKPNLKTKYLESLSIAPITLFDESRIMLLGYTVNF
jgi:hypothetical protein